jgi:hypothetical protein
LQQKILRNTLKQLNQTLRYIKQSALTPEAIAKLNLAKTTQAN